MTGSAHVLRADSLRAALSSSALRSLPSEVLASWLNGRRWFGAKGSTPGQVAIVDVVPVPWGAHGSAVARVRVTMGEQTLEYQLPLTVIEKSGTAATGSPASIATIEAGNARGLLIDATEDATFRQIVGETFEAGASFRGDSSTWVVETVGEAPGISGLPVKLGRAEQSNTSLLFGDRAILKFFRRIEEGENPDLEIGSALTEAGFENVPRLMGRVRFVTGEGNIDAGMLQQLVPRSVDAWMHALNTGRQYFSAPAGSKPVNGFARDAELLGRVTRAMHEALAAIGGKPAFALRPATPADVRGWVEKAKRSVSEGLDLLAAVSKRRGLPAERGAEAEALLSRRDHFSQYLDELAHATRQDAGARIRHHGDYHLGQVLRGADGKFYVIDFEGEPARSLAERREQHSALRDVAGMLRSFAYAAATLATETSAVLDPRTRELRSARWERDTREAFLRGYLAPNSGVGAFLPKRDIETRQLISLFEAEKVFYELAYELNNRPGWVWIPMRGISKLLVAPQSSKSGAASGERGHPARG